MKFFYIYIQLCNNFLIYYLYNSAQKDPSKILHGLATNEGLHTSRVNSLALHQLPTLLGRVTFGS